MIFYRVYSEDWKDETICYNWFDAWAIALWFGYKSYFRLSPQRIVVEKWKVWK